MERYPKSNPTKIYTDFQTKTVVKYVAQPLVVSEIMVSKLCKTTLKLKMLTVVPTAAMSNSQHYYE